MKRTIKVKCSVCGKLTGGRLPRRNGREHGDGTFWYPRKHGDCPGNYEEGKLFEVKKDGDK